MRQLVERVAEAGTQAEARQVQPGAFVFDRPAPAFRALHQRVEQAPQKRRGPCFALRPAGVRGWRAAGALLSCRPLSSGCRRRGRSSRWRHRAAAAGHRSSHQLFFAFRFAQLEGELPASAAVFGHAMHFERTDFAQRSHQLHRDLAARRGAGCGAQHGRNRRQAHDLDRIEIDQCARLRRLARIGHRRDEVKAHRPSQAQREAAFDQAYFRGGGRAAREQADGAQAGRARVRPRAAGSSCAPRRFRWRAPGPGAPARRRRRRAPRRRPGPRCAGCAAARRASAPASRPGARPARRRGTRRR